MIRLSQPVRLPGVEVHVVYVDGSAFILAGSQPPFVVPDAADLGDPLAVAHLADDAVRHFTGGGPGDVDEIEALMHAIREAAGPPRAFAAAGRRRL